MADNVVANAGAGGSIFAAPSFSFSGDTVVAPLGGQGILAGSEGAWTFTLHIGGAGAVTAGTPRMTLASDDPAVASLGVMDDWDESDRAKVNPIVGQAGVAAASGIVGVTTQRVVLATDVALPAGTNAIGKLAANPGVIIGSVEIAAAQTVAVTNAGTFAVQAAQSGTWNVNNISGTISLPTGAATAAKQPALGTAGVASADVITVQGVASMTPVQVSQATASSLNATVVGTGTFAVQAACTNAGTFVVQVDGSALTALQLIDDPVFTDDAAFTPGTSKVMVAGFQADETSTDSVDEGDAGAARMTLDRKIIVTPQPHAKGGLLVFRSLDLDETEEDVKTSAGQLYGWWIFNASTSIRYLKLYNDTAANVIVGTTTPKLTLPIPSAASGGVAANMLGAHGLEFDTAICAAVTTGLADNDTGAPSANDVIVNLFYK